MKNTMLLAVLFLIAFSATSATNPAEAAMAEDQIASSPSNRQIAPDRVAADPDTAEVLLENECVRVQYHRVAVGQKIPMHSHPHYLVNPLKAYRARVTLAGGAQRISARKAGEAFWSEAITHAIENIGDDDIHNLVVEVKSSGTCR